MAEAVLLTPAALLPEPWVSSEAVGEDAARVMIWHARLEQAIDLAVDSGRCVFCVCV